MRLSDILSNDPSIKFEQVENFMGNKNLKNGSQKKINAGVVGVPYFCKTCNSIITFNSKSDLYAVKISDNLVSIDINLKCSRCGESIATWFLIESENDMSSLAPNVRVIKKSEKLSNNVSLPDSQYGHYSELLNCAKIAYNNGLGAGAIIYLREIYEMLINEIADIEGIDRLTDKKKRKRNSEFIKEIDNVSKIIPFEFSNDSYKLYQELSNIIHGKPNEEDCLSKYHDFRRLIIGMLDNIKNNKELNASIIKIFGGGELK